MAFHDVAFQAESEVQGVEQPNCPRCGDTPLFPHTAEFAGDRRIRHSWVCETCGNAFHTTTKLPRSRSLRRR